MAHSAPCKVCALRGARTAIRVGWASPTVPRGGGLRRWAKPTLQWLNRRRAKSIRHAVGSPWPRPQVSPWNQPLDRSDGPNRFNHGRSGTTRKKCPGRSKIRSATDEHGSTRIKAHRTSGNVPRITLTRCASEGLDQMRTADNGNEKTKFSAFLRKGRSLSLSPGKMRSDRAGTG